MPASKKERSRVVSAPQVRTHFGAFPPGRVSLDRDDNIFLECAGEARADYLVTGNKRHFPKFWRSTKVINDRELTEIIAPHLRG